MILCRPDSRSTNKLLATALAAALLAAASPARAAETEQVIVVDLNHNRLVSLPRAPHRIVLGDPTLLQASVWPDGDGVLLTGTDGGETSIVIFDASGTPLMESTVRVESASDPDIFVQRGLERRAYHCAPLCKLVGVSADGGGGDARTGNGAASHTTNSNPTQQAGSGGL